MNCPKCGKDKFKVNIAWKQRLKKMPQFIPVRITCECGHNIKAYMVHEDMKAILGRLMALQEGQKELMKAIHKEPQPKKKKWWSI